MKTIRPFAKGLILFFIVAILFSSYSSITLVYSIPFGAKLYPDDEFVGERPYTMTDTKVVGTYTYVRLEMPGYEPFYTDICRNQEVDPGAIA
jgi:hypothetical protein